MTNEPAVSLIGVSKKYHLYDSLQERVFEALHPFKKVYHREFWALRNITLDIPMGRTVGILGLNGSGKSTLLQIICSILRPTAGLVRVRGRIAALIELGAGFNPELTGRANAELNSVMMGLTAREIKDRLPRIESFADIGEFFDQPVKTYSSGMFMRVAFATAINVDPDILVIDEALAVGDARFQQKCFRKFREFQNAGKTIILVTHDRFMVPRLCDMAMLLHKGALLKIGDPKGITELYSQMLALGEPPPANQTTGIVVADTIDGNTTSEPTLSVTSLEEQGALRLFLARRSPDDMCHLNPTYNKNEFRYGMGGAAIIDYLVVANGRSNPSQLCSGATLDLYLKVRFYNDVEAPILGIFVKSRDGIVIYGVNSKWLQQSVRARRAGEIGIYKFSVRMDLSADDWFIDLAVARTDTELMDVREGMVHLRIDNLHPCTGFAYLKTEFLEEV